MPTYYHVQRDGVRGFKTGKIYTFGQEPNFFSRDLFALDVRVPIAGVGEMPLDSVLKDYFDPAPLNYYQRIRSKQHTPDEKGLLGCARAVLNQHAKLLRELLFEEVRRESFPAKPSRFRAIWLIPHDAQTLERWCATAPRNQFRTFEVEATRCVSHRRKQISAAGMRRRQCHP